MNKNLPKKSIAVIVAWIFASVGANHLFSKRNGAYPNRKLHFLSVFFIELATYFTLVKFAKEEIEGYTQFPLVDEIVNATTQDKLMDMHHRVMAERDKELIDEQGREIQSAFDQLFRSQD